MKVLLISSNSNNSEMPPLGLFMLKAYTEEHMGFRKIDIHVHTFLSLEFVKIFKFILKEKPDVLAIGCYVWNYSVFMEICRKVKAVRPNITIILGGPNICNKDETLDALLQEDIVTYMIVGEGERIFSQLLFNLYDGKEEDNILIPNCMGKDKNGEIFRNPYNEEWRCELNTLPNPYMLYPEFLEASRSYGCVTLETSRGCPYNCSYCNEARFPFYNKDISIVLKELEFFHEKGITNISVLDATLNYNIERTKKLFSEIMNRGWKFDFGFEIKAECLDEELITMLTHIGVQSIEIGLQTSNKETLKRIHRYFDEKKFIDNIRKLDESDMNIVVDLIAGLPGETLEDWFASLDYCYMIGNIQISSNLLKLLPGTEIYNEKEKYAYEFDRYDFNSVSKSSTMTKEDISQIKKVTTILKYFWSNASKQWRQKMREVCDAYFEGSFSTLLLEIKDYVIEKGISKKQLTQSDEDRDEIVKEFLNCIARGGREC